MLNRISNLILKLVAVAVSIIVAVLVLISLTATPTYAAYPEGMGDLGGIYAIGADGTIVGDVIPVKFGNVDTAIITARDKVDWSEDAKIIVYDLQGDWSSTFFVDTPSKNVLVQLNGYTWNCNAVDGWDPIFECVLETENEVMIEGSGGTISLDAYYANGLINVTNNILLVKDTTFSNCHIDDAGVLCVSGTGAGMCLENVTFENCTNEGYGAAVYIDSDDSFSCSTRPYGFSFIDCTFRSCSAEEQGGAIYANSQNSSWLFDNCWFDTCSADDDGGALYFDEGENDVYIIDTLFGNCRAYDKGGMLYTNDEDNDFFFEGSTISKCSCVDDGGAIYVNKDDCDFSFKNTTFTECWCGGDGGAIFVDGSDITFDGNSTDVYRSNTTLFENCKADGEGGAIYTSNAAGCGNNVKIIGIDFIGNQTSAGNGGALCLCGTSNLVQYCFFRDNKAYEGDDWIGGCGGAIYIGTSGEDTIIGWDEDVQYIKPGENLFYRNYGEDEANEVYIGDREACVRNNTFYFTTEELAEQASNDDEIWDWTPSRVPVFPRGKRGNVKNVGYGETVRVVFSPGDGVTDAVVPAPITIEILERVPEPEPGAVRREGYQFKGWYNYNGYNFDFNERITNTLYSTQVIAKWTKVSDTFHVIYGVNGNREWGVPEDYIVPTDDTAYLYDAEVTVAAPLTTEQNWAIDQSTGKKVSGFWTFAWDHKNFKITENTFIIGNWEFTAKSVLTYEVKLDPEFGEPEGITYPESELLDNESYVVIDLNHPRTKPGQNPTERGFSAPGPSVVGTMKTLLLRRTLRSLAAGSSSQRIIVSCPM